MYNIHHCNIPRMIVFYYRWRILFNILEFFSFKWHKFTFIRISGQFVDSKCVSLIVFKLFMSQIKETKRFSKRFFLKMKVWKAFILHRVSQMFITKDNVLQKFKYWKRYLTESSLSLNICRRSIGTIIFSKARMFVIFHKKFRLWFHGIYLDLLIVRHSLKELIFFFIRDF